MKRNKKLAVVIVLILVIIALIVCYFQFKRDSVNRESTIEGYVKQVCLEDKKILICYDIDNISNNDYMGDCYIPIENKTVISDGRTINSIEQGEYIIVTYTGTLAEVFPSEIDGTVLIQFLQK